MRSSGQAAMEYISTYGWAILVIIVIGVVIWQLGLFDLQGKIQPGFSGFSVLLPVEWAMTGGCALEVQFSNGAGERIQNATVLGVPNSCAGGTIEPGDLVNCTKNFGSCGSPGSYYEEELIVTYERLDDQAFQTAGILWGSVE